MSKLCILLLQPQQSVGFSLSIAPEPIVSFNTVDFRLDINLKVKKKKSVDRIKLSLVENYASFYRKV